MVQHRRVLQGRGRCIRQRWPRRSDWPGIINWDFSTSKEFHISATNYIQLRFEAFNFLNHPNWGDPNTTFNSVAFGTINSTRTDMRQLQFGLKVVF